MELKSGYKQTDVGVIPEEWEITPLSELVTEFRGGAPLKPSDFTRTGIKVLPKGGVGRTGWLGIDDDDLQYCSPHYAAAHRNNQVDQSYTIVVLRDLVPSGPSIGLIVKIEEAETYVLAQGVYGFKLNQRAESRYLVQLSNTRWYRQLMNSIMVGSTQVHITNTAFRRAKIPLPKPPEQRAIAEALSDADALLGALDRLIAKKRDLKQAAMQQLLTGQTRLPGFSEQWKLTTLAQTISRFSTGLNPRQNFRLNAGGSCFYVTIKNFSSGQLFLDERCDLIDETALLKINERSDLRKDDILFSSIGRVGDAYLIRETPRNWNINESVFTLRPDKSQVVPLMLFYLLTSRTVKDALDQGVTGSTFKSIKHAELRAIPCRLPISHNEQAAIAVVLSDMDAELSALEARRDKTRSLKQAMMQELLTGSTRLV